MAEYTFESFYKDVHARSKIAKLAELDLATLKRHANAVAKEHVHDKQTAKEYKAKLTRLWEKLREGSPELKIEVHVKDHGVIHVADEAQDEQAEEQVEQVQPAAAACEDAARCDDGAEPVEMAADVLLDVQDVLRWHFEQGFLVGAFTGSALLATAVVCSMVIIRLF